MKTGTAILTSLLILIGSVILPGNIFARDRGYIPGEVLVKFKAGTSAGDADRLHAALHATKKKEIGRLHLQRLKLPKDLSVEEAVGKYRQDPNVEYAEPNYIVHALATIPDDTYFNTQWGLNNTGQEITNGIAGTVDADIDAPEAWDITTGSDSVLIAVIDSGVAFTDSGLAGYNPEFNAGIWTNDAEINGTTGVDDDGNGYTDDFYGWDFISNDGYPLDLNRHGTHVAGLIAAQGNNGLGTTGVMWHAKIMPVRFLGLTGSGSIADAIDAIDYAYVMGARIINCSWGSEYFSQSLQDTIERDGDALFVFAAGNTGSNNDSSLSNPTYPASYDSPNIIAVAATDENDSLASYSNYGTTSVDLAAPGSLIYSTIPLFSYGAPTTVYPQSGPVEDFENYPIGTLPSGWSRGGTNSTWAVTQGNGVNNSKCLEDSPDGDYANNTLSWVGNMTPLDSSQKGQRYLLSYDVKGQLLNYDWLDIIYSGNGSDWDWIDYLSGSGSAFATFESDYTSVAETYDSFYFGFRIDSNGSNTGDGVYIDNVKMTTQDIFIDPYDYADAANNYTYLYGTSMATPHVSGVAGLLLASNPDLTNLQLKDIILNSVDPVPGLTNKVLSGGRLNAYNALRIAPPAPPSGLSATAVSDSRIDLTWSDNSVNEDGFEIERKTGAAGTYSQIDTAGQNASTYSDSGLTDSTTYYYRVRAYNSSSDSAYSNETFDTTSSAATTTTTSSTTSTSTSTTTSTTSTTIPAPTSTTTSTTTTTSTSTTTTTVPSTSTGSGGGGSSGGGCFIATAAGGFL